MASIFDNPSAFEPMYDDPVAVRLSRSSGAVETTVMACVFSAADGEALSGEAVASDREDVVVAVRDADWPSVSRLRIGDRLVFNGSEFAFVSARRDSVLGWVVKARSTGGAA